MSEIRYTEPVEAIEVPPSEPLISLSDILMGVGWLAFQGTKLAVKGAVAGSILAYKGARAVTKAIQESRPLLLRQVDDVIAQANSAKEALTHLAAAPGFEIPQAEAEQCKSRAEALATANDKLGVAAMAREIVRTRQDRLQTTLLTLATESCREIGFNAVTLRANHGSLVAKSADGRQTITVEVDKAKDGDLKLHFDADGFHGGACIQALDALHKRMASKGVRFRVGARKRKEQRPAFDGKRTPQVIRARSGR